MDEDKKIQEAGVICRFPSSKEWNGEDMTSFKWYVSRVEGHNVQNGSREEAVEQFSSMKRKLSISPDQGPPGKLTKSMPNPDFDAAMMENVEAVSNANLVITKGVHLLVATETLGKHFEQYIKDIWSYLMDDSVFRIAIHGVGGVGKTEVAKHINNMLLQNPNKFHHVFWVNASPNQATVSPLCRVRNLQISISETVGVDLSEEADDDNIRAALLSKWFTKQKKSLVILDDVWDYISLQELGIPVGVDGCTVLFTTRSLQVCRESDCHTKIQIGCLPLDESYELFNKILGSETILSGEAKEISSSVVDKCAGLPLAITIMARKLKGATDTLQWRNALTGLTLKEVYMEVFQKLKISFDYLKHRALQQCFLYCPLLVEEGERCFGFPVRKRRLADYLLDEGFIKGMNSRREELAEAHAMLDCLRDVGLLEITSSNAVKMNALIWRMALQIMEESEQRVMVKKGMSLKVLPDQESWNEDLGRVSLEGNEIESIPSHFSPSCPKLSTLLLSRNDKLGFIGHFFFKGMPGLKLLDLSHTSIESLPSSVCGLVNLTTLLLSYCRKLKNISSVPKLKMLKKLDLSFSGVEEVPEDIVVLSKLAYLDLSYTLVVLESTILTNFPCLQFLALPWSSTVEVEILARLSRLEILTCSFNDAVELDKYLKAREPPMKLHVQVGRGPRETSVIWDHGHVADLFAEEEKGGSVVRLYNCEIKESAMFNYFQDILIVKCNEERSLCNFSPIKGASELKYFSIRECDVLEFLCSLPLTGQGLLEKIQYMDLTRLKNLSFLLRKEGDVAYGSCFSNLTRFNIHGCPRVKWLFPIRLVQNLKNLEILDVVDCPVMEGIFGAEEEEKEEESKKFCCLPKLTTFWLIDLPKLKSVCRGRVFLLWKNSTMKVKGCPNIERDGIAVYVRPGSGVSVSF